MKEVKPLDLHKANTLLVKNVKLSLGEGNKKHIKVLKVVNIHSYSCHLLFQRVLERFGLPETYRLQPGVGELILIGSWGFSPITLLLHVFSSL